MTPEIRKLLVAADSLLSLVAHRHRVSTIPDDVVEEMLRVSSGCRAAVEAHDRAAGPGAASGDGARAPVGRGGDAGDAGGAPPPGAQPATED